MRKLLAVTVILTSSAVACAAAEEAGVTTDPVESQEVETTPAAIAESLHTDDSGKFEELNREQPSLKTDVESLSEDVKTLRKKVDDGESDSGSGFTGFILSLLSGAVGGAAATIYLQLRIRKKNMAANDPKDRRGYDNSKKSFGDPITNAPSRPQTASIPPATPETKIPVPSGKTPSVPASGRKDNQEANSVPPQYEKDPIPSKAKRPSEPRKRLAYGSLSIPAEDMIIVEDGNLSDSFNGQPYQFELDEKKGTATYTFAPQIMDSVISNLSRYEKFMESFDYDPLATKINVKSPGRLMRKDGYWQVEKRITIILS